MTFIFFQSPGHHRKSSPQKITTKENATLGEIITSLQPYFSYGHVYSFFLGSRQAEELECLVGVAFSPLGLILKERHNPSVFLIPVAVINIHS